VQHCRYIYLAEQYISSTVRRGTGASPRIAGKEHEAPMNRVRKCKNVIVFLLQTSIDKVVAALMIAQTFTASDHLAGSRQSKNSDFDSSSDRKRNTVSHVHST
jgi:hypothetical protein